VKFLLKTDSTETKAVENKGSRKAKLNEPLRQVLAQLARKRHSVVAEYVPGVTPSGQTVTYSDNTKRLDDPGDVLWEVWHRMSLRPTIDAFADDQNHHLPHYLTYLPSPHASGTDAMAKVWHRGQLLHINPPWGMIPRNLAKLKNDKARAVIVAPRWQSAWWWPTLQSMMLGPPYIISGSIYKDRDSQLAPAPRWLTQVCLLDGTRLGGTTKNTGSICIRAPRGTSRQVSGSGCIRRPWQPGESTQVSREIRRFL